MLGPVRESMSYYVTIQICSFKFHPIYFLSAGLSADPFMLAMSVRTHKHPGYNLPGRTGLVCISIRSLDRPAS